MVKVTVWPTNSTQVLSEDTGDAGSLRGIEFTGNDLDIDGRVTLMGDENEAELTLWNLGDPKHVLSIFRDDFIVAIDLGRSRLTSDSGVPMFRAFAGKVRHVGVVPGKNRSTDVGYRITCLPLSETLNDVEIEHTFQYRDRGWSYQQIAERLLNAAGMPFHQVIVDENARLPNHTADGSVKSELKRTAAMAGLHVAIVQRGYNVLVTDRFLPVGFKVDQDAILDAKPQEEKQLYSPMGMNPLFNQQTGEGFDLLQNSEAVDEQRQIAGGTPPGSYEVMLPLSPDITKQSVLVITGSTALGRMGLTNIDKRSFNVDGVEHSFSSRSEAPMDTTRLVLNLRAEENSEDEAA